jgi:MarR family transcriptional regulator, organic hydroperoxide resistance regulator
MSPPHRPRAAAAKADQLWASMIEMFLGMRGWWSALCEELRLTPAQGLALRSLEPDRPLAMSTLADALACDASNITGIVDKLESRGLIARRGADHDRRIKMLVVTERGRSLRERLIARAMQPPSAFCDLPSDMCTRLNSLFHAILEERKSPPPPPDSADRRRRPGGESAQLGSGGRSARG